MFWKSVKVKPLKNVSLATQLMLLYAFSTCCLLAAISLFLYPTFRAVMAQLNTVQAFYLKAQCDRNVIIALTISALGALVLGKLVASRGLSRIEDFAMVLEKITASSLHERVNLTACPKELQLLGEEFNQMLDRLEASFDQLSQFSSDLAHELRTPLNNLCGITELALAKKNLPAEYRNTLEVQLEHYHYLAKLIESLLFLARSDQRQVTLSKQQFSAREEILKMLDYYQAVADENKIQLSCEGDAPVVADLILFKRVIDNLLSNALKYTPVGKVCIQIKAIEKNGVEVAVHDTGIGIEQHHLSKITDRFYRVDGSRFSESGGLGLGLAIVKSIMDLHQGKMLIKSELHQGTSIYLYFLYR